MSNLFHSFHCLFCLGYENRGSPSSGVPAVQAASFAPLAVHFAETAGQLSAQVTIYTNGSEDLGVQINQALSQATATTGEGKFKVDSRSISRLSLVYGSDGQPTALELTFSDDTTATEAFLVHNPLTQVKWSIAGQLGLELTPSPIPGNGDISANAPMHQTSLRGVFAAGDCITPYKMIPGAISSGCNAAVAASTQLLAEYGHVPLF
jgi:gliotoxin/aspirochlorine biosynthesis thioredoxin reductase